MTSGPHTLCDRALNIDNQEIKKTERMKLLGVYIDENLTFAGHISVLCTRTSQKIGVLVRLCNQIRPYDFSLQLKCLHERTGHRDLSHEQFTRSVLRNQVAGTCSKNSNWFEFIGLVVRLVGTKLSATRF